MILDNGKHVIVANEFGNSTAYACTLDNAQRLLRKHESTLYAEVRALLKQDLAKTYVVSTERFTRAIHELTALPVDAPGFHLRTLLHGIGPKKESPDTRPVALATQALKDELALWCVRHRINPLEPTGLSHQLLTKELLGTDNSLGAGVKELAGERTVHIVDNWVLEVFGEWNLLAAGQWKPEVKEDRVVNRFLAFLTEHLVHREVRFEVCLFKAEV